MQPKADSASVVAKPAASNLNKPSSQIEGTPAAATPSDPSIDRTVTPVIVRTEKIKRSAPGFDPLPKIKLAPPAEPTSQTAAIVSSVSPLQSVTAASKFSASKPLTLERERALRPKDIFKECDTCPEMVVVPTGSL